MVVVVVVVVAVVSRRRRRRWVDVVPAWGLGLRGGN